MKRDILSLARPVRTPAIASNPAPVLARPHRLSVSEFARQEGLSEGQMRWWLFNRHSNGLQAAGACVRIGRRIYIDPAGFERWIENQQAAA
jgi:hypothetical protein